MTLNVMENRRMDETHVLFIPLEPNLFIPIVCDSSNKTFRTFVCKDGAQMAAAARQKQELGRD